MRVGGGGSLNVPKVFRSPLGSDGGSSRGGTNAGIASCGRTGSRGGVAD